MRMEQSNFEKITLGTVMQKGVVIREPLKDGTYKYYQVGDYIMETEGFEIRHLDSLIITLKKISMVENKYEIQQ